MSRNCLRQEIGQGLAKRCSIKGLAHASIAARPMALFDLLLHDPCRDGDDGPLVAGSPELTGRFVSVDRGQTNIHENEIKGMVRFQGGFDKANRFLPLFRHGNRHARIAKHRRHEPLMVFVVFHQEKVEATPIVHRMCSPGRGKGIGHCQPCSSPPREALGEADPCE